MTVIKVHNQKEEKRLTDEIFKLTSDNNIMIDENAGNKKIM